MVDDGYNEVDFVADITEAIVTADAPAAAVATAAIVVVAVLCYCAHAWCLASVAAKFVPNFPAVILSIYWNITCQPFNEKQINCIYAVLECAC